MSVMDGLNPIKIFSAYREHARKFNDLTALEKDKYDNAILEWQSHLNQDYERGDKWYLYAGAVLLGLIIYGIVTNQWSFSVALLVFGGVYYFVTHQETPVIKVKLTSDGLKIGERVYPFTEIKTFWIEYNPPYFQNLHLVLKNSYKQEITVQVHQVNIADLRTVLSRYLPEWKERNKSFTESIIQSFGL